MRKNMRKAVVIVAFVLAITATLSMIFNERSYFTTMINVTFLASLVILMVGGTMFILEGGLFNGIIHSFKRFFKSSSRKQRYAEEYEFDESDDEPQDYSFTYTLPFLTAGTFLFIVTLFFSYFV